MDRLRLPTNVGLFAAVPGILIPGFAFSARGQRGLGAWGIGSCLLLGVVFFAELGRAMSNTAFGLLLAVHVSGISYLFGPLLAGATFRFRMLFTLLVLTAIGIGLYAPAVNYIDRKWFKPLNVKNQTVVVQRLHGRPRLQRGEIIAYDVIKGKAEHALVTAGAGMGPVLAVPGDEVRFTKRGFEVNGVLHPSRPRMPHAGGFVVEQKHWFVWPDFDTAGHGAVAETLVSETVLQVAVISEQELIGKPFEHWFWHRQIDP